MGFVLNESVSPKLLKSLSLDEKASLCEQLRSFIIRRVSENGGHLASNLGTVELIVALHSVFETPQDKIVFDVGHQAYAHKIITGRYSEFSGLRAHGGISGYPRPSESVHDAFVAGHSGISISAALGLSEAMLLSQSPGKAIAVAGDGAFTNGEIYEGLNNILPKHKNLLVILNDNEMSIAKNSGAIAGYLSKLHSKNLTRIKWFVKNALNTDNLFESLGFRYYGSINGHDLAELINVFNDVKQVELPCFVHVKTIKGKGFVPAENNAPKHHAISAKQDKADTFSEVFGRALLFSGNKNKKICAITAAMKNATGCDYFAKQYPERFFDVGIAEGHAITFAAGLAAGGMCPVVAIYSTFLQRGYDQLIHDVSIENTHIVFAVDRAGLVGEDGETHQGTFDMPIFNAIPGMVVYCPSNADELRLCLERAVETEKGPVAVRYPRGICHSAPYSPVNSEYRYIKADAKQKKPLIITYGRLTYTAVRLSRLCADVIQLIRVKPLPEAVIAIAKEYNDIFFIEESSECGGVGESLLKFLHNNGWNGNYSLRGIKGFVPYGDIETQLRLCGLDYNSLAMFIFKRQVEEEKRLDITLAERGFAKSRTVAQELIKKGCITVNGNIIEKPSELVKGKDKIKMIGEQPKYVSRGGNKLEKALKTFNIDLNAKICLDVGASTGGFTDCMLQQGALTVYTVDVGSNQLDRKLLGDDRVVCFEQLDIRKAQDKIVKKFDFITVDVSFISLKLVLPNVVGFMKEQSAAIALIKPQFEVGKKYLKNGIVTDKDEREGVVANIKNFISELGFKVGGIIKASPPEPDKNTEYLIYFRRF
ncbi:MAG: 1-deoxy-D-xylulose-5-phosphate synthase [Oscillospiraceae bacterium]|nr:1-deoxy-D-xylulose-5-phosphate synthase [Oscillospiraceae bacterium]